jgi:WbqC-like protein family.
MKDPLVVIHQPDFMPYLGFFHRLLLADIYIVLDNVQYVRGSRTMTSRDKIKTVRGEQWINVGIRKPPYGCMINEIFLSEEDSWKKRGLNLIKENYRAAEYFGEIYPYMELLYSFPCNKMVDFNMKSIELLMLMFDIKDIEIKYASELKVTGKSNERIIRLVKAAGSRRYLSGTGARNYFIPELYEDAGVEVVWQEFKHPVYPQQFDGFIPYLSSIDLLFNCGIRKAKEILRDC